MRNHRVRHCDQFITVGKIYDATEGSMRFDSRLYAQSRVEFPTVAPRIQQHDFAGTHGETRPRYIEFHRTIKRRYAWRRRQLAGELKCGAGVIVDFGDSGTSD